MFKLGNAICRGTGVLPVFFDHGQDARAMQIEELIGPGSGVEYALGVRPPRPAGHPGFSRMRQFWRLWHLESRADGLLHLAGGVIQPGFAVEHQEADRDHSQLMIDGRKPEHTEHKRPKRRVVSIGGDEMEAPSGNGPKRALSAAEVATCLHVAPLTVYKLCQKGRLAPHRAGRAIRIQPADLDACRRQATEAAKPCLPMGRHSKFRI